MRTKRRLSRNCSKAHRRRSATGKAILDSDIFQEGLGKLQEGLESYNAWKVENPEPARNVEAVLQIANGALTLTGVGAIVTKGPQTAIKVGKAAIETGGKVVEAGVKATEAVIKTLRTALKRSKTPKKDIVEALDQRTIDIVQAEALAKEFGVELPASSFATPAKAKAEQIIGEGFFGKKLKTRAEKAIDDFSENVSSIQTKALKSGELGENILNKFKAVEAKRKAVIKNLYDQVEKSIQKAGEKLVIDTPKAQNVLETLITRKKTVLKAGIDTSTEIKKLTTLKKGIANNSELNVQRAALKEIGDMANFDSFTPSTDEKLFRKLWRSLKDDIDESIIEQMPEIGKLLKKSNKAFAELQALKERPFAKSIKKLGKVGDVDTIADRLTKTKVSTNEVKEIYKTLGPETTNQIQEKIIADIIEKAKSASETFTPTGFSRQLKSIGDERLKVLLKSQQITLLKNIDKINRLVAKGLSITKGSQTALIQQVTKVLRVPFTGVGEFILARLFNTKAGQLFLKGVDKKTIKALESKAKDSSARNSNLLFPPPSIVN